MQKLKVLTDRHTFQEAIDGAIDFRPPGLRNDRLLFEVFARSSNRMSQIGSGFELICWKHLDFRLAAPAIEAFDAAAAALPYRETVAAMRQRLQQTSAELELRLQVPQIGRIEWADSESCRFTYFEVEKDYGILRNTVRRIAHQHDLVKAKQHRLPATDIPMPKRARQIIRAIPSSLQRYTRVITGLEVRKDVHEESRRQEPTWLGKALDDSKRHVHDAAKAAGLGLAAVGSAVATGLSGALARLAAPLAVADPALVVGEIVLYGWEQP